jgi:hypothetical protein
MSKQQSRKKLKRERERYHRKLVEKERKSQKRVVASVHLVEGLTIQNERPA